MEAKTTLRYFVGKNDNDFSRQLIDSDVVLPKLKWSEIKAYKEKKEENKNQKKQFINNGIFGKNKIKKYERRSQMDISSATNKKKFRQKLINDEKRKQNSIGFAARSELLLPESSGYLSADENEKTYQISQREIVESVDITSATKHFDLNLHLGEYAINYYKNGRHLLIGGRRGHVAAIDWVTKDLICEFNVQESVHDIHWLHMPTMFAVAQKDWVYIYDNKGTQIHCLKKLYRICKLDFLNYHFLLVSASDNGYISWLDVSMGKTVASHKMKVPRLTALKQNPYNAIMTTGHPNGIVQMWSPNQSEPVATMLCHPSAVRDIAFDVEGKHMVTAGTDRTVRIWDVRNFKCLQSYRLRAVPSHLDISQRNLLAVSVGNVVEVYKDCFQKPVDTPYMRHRLNDNISDVEFCDFEDILGIGHQKGFTSVIIPGSGEPNFDALESNPFMTVSQRREMEVKALLDKIPADLISLDPTILGTVDTKVLKSQMEDKKKVRYVKPKNIEFETIVRKRKRQKTAKKEKVKKELRDVKKRSEIRTDIKQKKNSKQNKEKSINNNNEMSVLDRFKTKQ